MADDSATAIDFAVVTYLEEGCWRVSSLATTAARDLDTFVRTLRQMQGDIGCIGSVSVDDDFFILVRVVGDEVRYLLSDVTAATDWPLAREVLDELALPVPIDEDDEDQAQPAGDLTIVADLGMAAMEMGALCDDLDLYPDEMLSKIAERLGYGPAFQRAVEASVG
ncbi:tRNA adenosine deaminase-associated protein [Actinopolymorpha sp. NPDC004070]|uniref:tRNA adenosine deaminase-associated protein n=1 Tax=Actinopolymorpha sp. NPDC004070 TaxID=3154548 RepID=UPI0033AB0CE2